MSKEETNIQCCMPQSENIFDQNYWDERWQKSETGWDTGQASPAIIHYMASYPNKNGSILIPGCGNAYEAEFLIENGFTNITLIDIAPKAVEILQQKFVDKPQVKVLCEDFFKHTNHYDIIIEQTFFCAISPSRRKEYVEKAASLLNENGKIMGVLFDKQFHQAFPPFGGSVAEYTSIFEPYFAIKVMHPCYNSILPRAGTEVFIHLIKK